MYSCVECGNKSSDSLYKTYKKSEAIQLTKCEICDHFVDKYVEFDDVILLLDIILLRIESYRHMIFNYDINSLLLWRLSIGLILSEGYIKFRLMQLSISNWIVLQTHFHLAVGQSLLEFALIVFLLWLLLTVALQLDRQIDIKLNCNFLLRIVILSNFVKFFAIISMIWVDEFYIQFLLLLSLPIQIQTSRDIFRTKSYSSISCVVKDLMSYTIFSSHWIKPTVIVAIQVVVLTALSRQLNIYRLILYNYL